MKRYRSSAFTAQEMETFLKRPSFQNDAILQQAKLIIDEVKSKGDLAIKDFTQRFDGVQLDQFLVPQEELEAAERNLSEDFKNAVELTAKNIERFHRAQMTNPVEVETMAGVRCWRKAVPLQSIGLYIPAGTAPLPSTVLMLGIPAQIADVKEVIICSPPKKDGSMASEILYAAKYCGIKKIFRIGGAQSIAAMSYGTQTVPKVNKIFGPGNAYVTAAKLLVSSDPEAVIAIDMPAGPSELLVIADEKANAAFVAADLLSQAEHGADSQVILLATSEALIDNVEREIQKQLAPLPRKAIAEQALAKSVLMSVESLQQACDISNQYAPEHLILQVENPARLSSLITQAGSVFLGAWSPESVGDYASGTNHTLPTSGYASCYSGVSLDNYFKFITFQELSQEGLQGIGRIVEILAETEQLQAHKNAVSLRLQSLSP